MELQRKSRTVRPAGPLDGGYGWFIVLSTFLVFGLTFGVIKSFGVFFVEIHHYFATTATASSWITSISVATVHFGAPIGSALSTYFGHRPVVMVGGLLSSIGMVAGSYAQDLLQLYITVGFLTGFGYALTWTPTVTMLGWYFEKRLPVANTLASLELLSQTYTDSKISNDRSDSKKSDPLKVKIISFMDYTLIANARFMVYSVFGVFAALGFFAPSLFLVPYARSQGTVHQLTVTVILLGIVLLLCPLASTFTQLALFSAGYGLVFGATVAIHITVLAEVVGVERLGSALGFFMLIRSSGGLLGPPLAGIFIDKMNDYGAGFLMAGVALLVSALFLLVLQHMNKKGTEKGKDINLENGKGHEDTMI
uniref:Si:dkey-246g23.4 n=1 Tax=Cyprinus carpio carpio TaxID=630221 RepID=A0A9J8B5I3_CYPCA